MTTFDEREQAFKRMFVQDEETRFRALARRNKALGLWAAELMRLSRQEAATYAEDLIRNGIVAAQGDERLVQKLSKDMERADTRVSEDAIREKMSELLAKAIAEIKSGPA